MRLRVFERLHEREVSRNLLGCRGLQQQVVSLCRRLRERVRRLGQRALWDRRRRGGCRGVEVLYQRPAEVDDGAGRVDGDAGEEGKVLAAVRVSCEV